MSRKIKALGLALVAALAMSAVAVSAAQAAEFHSESESTTLTGSQTTSHEFTVGSGFGAIKCKVAEFSGKGTKKTEATQVITPVYKECTDSFGRTVDVTINAVYKFTPAAPTAEANVHVEGEFKLTVTDGSGNPLCHVVIKSQTNNGITYHNVTSGGVKAVEVTTHTNNVTSETSGGFFNCGTSNGHHTGGSYTGNTLMKGTSGGVATGIWVE